MLMENSRLVSLYVKMNTWFLKHLEIRSYLFKSAHTIKLNNFDDIDVKNVFLINDRNAYPMMLALTLVLFEHIY